MPSLAVWFKSYQKHPFNDPSFLKIYLLAYLFLAALGFNCCAFSGSGDFSCCRAQVLGVWAEKLGHKGFVGLPYVESSWTRNQTYGPTLVSGFLFTGQAMKSSVTLFEDMAVLQSISLAACGW